MSPMLPEFENTLIAFEYRSDKELKHARFLFSSMSSPVLTRMGMKLTSLAKSLKLPVKGIIKHTLFDHFYGGETWKKRSALLLQSVILYKNICRNR